MKGIWHNNSVADFIKMYSSLLLTLIQVLKDSIQTFYLMSDLSAPFR